MFDALNHWAKAATELSFRIIIASQRQYSLDFSEKFKIYYILKRITSLYQGRIQKKVDC